MQRKLILILTISLLVLLLGLNEIARAQETAPAGTDASLGTLGDVGTLGSVGTAFTYEGQLKDASGPVTGSCDFQFSLWDDLTSGALVGTTLEQLNVTVSEGLFAVQLDFGANAFTGSARWLETAVRCPAGSGSYTSLSPRQLLTPAPYALYSANAGTAANLSGVLPVSNGGTGSATKNFVDLSTDQPVGGVKTFSSAPSFTALGAPFSVSSTGLVANLNADTLDGQHASAFQQNYQNLVVVAKSGGDYSTITDALNSITTNSAANPFTIYVAPGIYTEKVTMKPYVDIEGAGETATKITYTGSHKYYDGTVLGASNTELRFLTVENSGGDNCAVAIYNDYASLRMTNITAIASGGIAYNYGVYNNLSASTMTNMVITATGEVTATNYGVYNQSDYRYLSPPVMMNVIATASGGAFVVGVENDNSSPVMMSVTATASGGTISNEGVGNDRASPTMTDVTATGLGEPNAYGVRNSYSSPTMNHVTATASGLGKNIGVENEGTSSPVMINVIATGSYGNLNYGVYNDEATVIMTYVTAAASEGSESYGIYNTNALITMTNVIATASDTTYQSVGVGNYDSSVRMTNVTASALHGTGTNIGVYNSNSSQPMVNVTASASGGNWNRGVFNSFSSPPMTNVTATGSGGTYSYGIYNTSSSPTISNVNATAIGGTNNYGMWNDFSSLTIQNSVISASGGSLNDGIHDYGTSGSYTVKISNSQITGSTSTIYHEQLGTSSLTTQLGASQVIGSGVQGSGTYTCVASYNGDFVALNPTTCH